MLATTTPYDLVKPLADRLGLDDVVATKYGVNADGTYDGTVVGPFVWASGKLEAVQAWAAEHDIELSESYAYSDSFYDTPLLDAVGTPIVVNPDPRMLLMATARRWPILNLDVSPGVVKIPVLGIELQRVALQFSRPSLMPYVRFDIDGVDHIPAAGPAILVANHRSYFDPLAMSVAIAQSGRTVRFLGKKEVFDVPIVGSLATAMGGIRVDRGTGSDEPLEAAADALAGGEVVAIMPEGTIPRGTTFFEPAAEGPVGRRPPGRPVEGAGDPDRAVGHEQGVAPIEPLAEPLQPHRSARGPDPHRATRRSAIPIARCRHEADHEGHRQPASGRSAAPVHADAGGAGRHLSARVQGRSRAGAEPPTGHRLTGSAAQLPGCCLPMKD